MKTLATLVRHNVTYLVGLLVAWLVSHLTLPADIQAVTEAGEAIIAPLSLLAGAVAVVLSRLLLTWAGTLFRTGAGEESSRPSGGMPPLVVIGLGLSMAAVGTLPSCSPGLAGEYPLTASLSYREPKTGAKAGLTYTPKLKRRGGVTVPVYDAETGERIGTTTIQVDPQSGK